MHCQHSLDRFLLTQSCTNKALWSCRRYCCPSAQACTEAGLLQLVGKPYSPSSYSPLIDVCNRAEFEDCTRCSLTCMLLLQEELLLQQYDGLLSKKLCRL